jgi:hypothetical protein
VLPLKFEAVVCVGLQQHGRCADSGAVQEHVACPIWLFAQQPEPEVRVIGFGLGLVGES